MHGDSQRTPIDLTLIVTPEMRGVEIQTRTHFAEAGYNTTTLHLYSHSGTHLDAPLHFMPDGSTLERMPLQKCMGTAVVLNLSHKSPRSLITIADMHPIADQIGHGTRLLLRTDWDAHANQSDYRTHFPRISLELAEWLASRKIWLLGLETPSVASLQDKKELTVVHQALLKEEIVIVESLSNLRHLPNKAFFIALPLKIEGGDGSPVRAIALI